ncbi:MAG: Oligopeptide transport system permease protein OppB (TC 3.A.1.5.1) [uncultured Thiotrichaceae bacterium]|uniref:Oligopeptide transport system permease protein OppB (TC 3.A.1.5.1) n=1 Tax=uncultured Thiotrichaceae bacterium TaxID=298394 RepID=A0A6S6SAC9_9GAMM|nr:MAG: Oligopeptide transport system permease protein OppB (TC 3.A.1.5.1) [uncultured Thiotrichaceae bacterium]
MLNYLLRRFLLMFPTLLGITILVFTVMAASPGGITAQTLAHGMDMKPAERKALEEYYNKRYGLDDPPPIQYLRWVNNISPIGFVINDKGELDHFSFTKGSDLGESFNYGRPVGELIKERLPITLLLNVITIPLIYIIAIIVGVKAATDRGGRFDVSSNVFMLGLWSVPTMLAGVLMIGFFANIQHWQWFPTAGLSEFQALDMPFLPTGLSLMDVLKTFLFMTAGVVIMTVLSQLRLRQLRTAIAGAVGIGIGLWMASAHAENITFNYIALPLLFVGIMGLMAWTDYLPFRIGGLATIGAGIGLILALQSMDGVVRGYLFDRIWHLILPVIALSYGGFAFLAKLTRTSILENLSADYARTARAKGVSEQNVLWVHVFRNSLIPLITVSASLLPALLSGSVIVESIFSIDGMGKLVIDAVKGRDRELVLSLTLITGFLTLLSYLIADFLYTLVDPRVSYE